MHLGPLPVPRPPDTVSKNAANVQDMGAAAFVLLTPTQGRDGRQWVSDPAFSLAERTRPPRRRRSHWAEGGKRPPLPQPSLDAADQEVFVTGWWEGQGLGLSKQERGEKNL